MPSPRALTVAALLVGLAGVFAACGDDEGVGGTATSDAAPVVDEDVLLAVAVAEELGTEGVDDSAEEAPILLLGTGFSEDQQAAVVDLASVDVEFVGEDADPEDGEFWEIGEVEEANDGPEVTVSNRCVGHCGRQLTYLVDVGEDAVTITDLRFEAIE